RRNRPFIGPLRATAQPDGGAIQAACALWIAEALHRFSTGPIMPTLLHCTVRTASVSMDRSSEPKKCRTKTAVEPALVAARVPHGLFIMTAAHEDSSTGTLVRWVQRCSDDPVVILVSLRRGQGIEPLIRDSRAFAICQISEDDRFLQRKFSNRCTSATADDEE